MTHYALIRFLVVLLASALTLPAFAQSVDLDWAVAVSEPGADEHGAVVTDADGNVYAAGATRASSEQTDGDIVLTKYDADGNFVWQYTVADSGDEVILGMDTDNNGNVYCIGPDQQDHEFFVFKRTTDNAPVWSRVFTGDGPFGRSIAVDAQGNSYLTGFFANSMDADPGLSTHTLTADGALDVFVIKLDANGDFVWARSMGGTGVTTGQSIAVDIEGVHVAIAGWFTLLTDLDPGLGEFHRTAVGQTDGFLCQLDNAGNFMWGGAFGGTAEDIASDVEFDGANQLRVVGSFKQTVDFDIGSDPADVDLFTAAGDDMFLLTLSSLGDYVRNAQFGGLGVDGISALAIDADRNLYIAGTFQQSVSIGGGTLEAETDQDMLLVKLSPTETFIWGVGLAATEGGGLTSVAVASSGAVLGAGLFDGDLDADTSTGSSPDLAATTQDAFLVAYHQQSNEAEFVDPQLEQAVRDALFIPSGPIPVLSLAAMTSLNASGRGIQMLDGLEDATGLESLDLSYNAIQSLDPLLDNTGLDSGDLLVLYGNPLDQNSICDTIPTLQGLGVDVGFEGTCGVISESRVQGFVESNETPLTDAAVLITQDDVVVGTTIVDDGGYYEINGLTASATYTFEFFALGHIPESIMRTLVDPITEISVDLDPAGDPALGGSIVDDAAESNAVSGALVTVTQNDTVIARTVAYANGQFEFHTLPATKADPVTVDITAPSYVGETIVVDPDDAEPVDTVLEKINLPGSLVGTVIDPQETAVPDAQVVVQQTPAGFSAERTSTGEGAYSVASVPDGTYEVRAVVKDIGWGMNNGDVQQDLATIDVELLRDARECLAPDAPEGLNASDGSDGAAVNLSWNTVNGPAIEYQVYRGTSANFVNATPLSDWITDTTFDDTTAAAPTAGGSGCNGGMTFQTYHYWVIARTASNLCESEASASDSGYRGEVASAKVDTAGAANAAHMLPLLVALAALVLVPSRQLSARASR